MMIYVCTYTIVNTVVYHSSSSYSYYTSIDRYQEKHNGHLPNVKRYRIPRQPLLNESAHFW